MRTRFICFLLLAAKLMSNAGNPFGLKRLLKPIPYIIIGLSGVVIDDDGRPVKGVFNVKKTWNSSYFPTRITLEGSFLKKWSAELSMAYSPLQAGKILGDKKNLRVTNANLYMFDLSAKYYPLSLGSRFFSPYGIMGLGYTDKIEVISKNGMSVNAGLGISLWLDKSLGINVQSMGKFKVNSGASNYLMHTLGIVYRIGNTN